MSRGSCEICLSKKTALRCSLCNQLSCKLCSHFIDDSIFELEDLIPEHLANKAFCPNCYDEKVGLEVDAIINTMELAKNVNVYSKVQGTETRLMRRVAKPLKVNECEDREETLLRLAYMAAKDGYDTIVDVDITSKKVNLGGRYRKVVWSGTATPIDSDKK